MPDMVELYTRQNENSIFEILQKGYMTNKELYIRLHMGPDAAYFIDRYRTFVKMAEKIVPRPPESDYPIWTSISKNNCLRPENNSLVYCLRVPKDQIIYLDGLKWDYVLNYLYVPKDEADLKDHQKEISKLGIKSEHEIFNGKYQGLFPEMETKIRQSWYRIFEIDNWSEFIVQGNLWLIKKEWIYRVLHQGDDLFAEPERPLNLEQDAQLVKDRQVARQAIDYSNDSFTLNPHL